METEIVDATCAPAEDGKAITSQRFARLFILSLATGIWIWFVPKTAFHTWGVFHYYLSARYFDQLGYEALYSCALAADDGRVWPEPDFPVRDLQTYEMSTAAVERTKCPIHRFSPEEWVMFVTDLQLLQTTTEWDRYVLNDKGFNGTPVWVMTARAALWLLPLSWLIWADAVLIFGAVAWIAYRAGLEKAALMLLFIFSFWGTFGRVTGHFLQFLWLPLLLLGVQHRQAGLLVGAAAWQIFPAIALVDHRLAWRSRVSLVAILLVGVATVFTPWNWWMQFAVKMARHSLYIHRELLNVGLPNLLATFGVAYSPPFTQAAEFTIAPAMLIILAYPLLRYYRRSEHCYAPLFGLLTLSRYYYLGLGVMVLDSAGWGYALLAWNLAAYALTPANFGWVQVGLYLLLDALVQQDRIKMALAEIIQLRKSFPTGATR